jgi:hypothetical protein
MHEKCPSLAPALHHYTGDDHLGNCISQCENDCGGIFDCKDLCGEIHFEDIIHETTPENETPSNDFPIYETPANEIPMYETPVNDIPVEDIVEKYSYKSRNKMCFSFLEFILGIFVGLLIFYIINKK